MWCPKWLICVLLATVAICLFGWIVSAIAFGEEVVKRVKKAELPPLPPLPVPDRTTLELINEIGGNQARICELVLTLSTTIAALREEVRDLKAIATKRQVIRLRLAGGANVETHA